MENIQSGNESKDFLGLKEFFSLFAKLVGSIAGLAALFMLLGYMIILSFVNNIKLYGLASFPQEFYKEATMKFISDMFETYGRHPYCSGVMVVLIALIALVGIKYIHHFRKAVDIKIAAATFSILSLVITLLTLRLEIIPDKLFFIKDMKKIFVFMVSVPVLISTFLYLALKFREFMFQPFRYYYVTIFLFAALFISIPVGYGDNIFDIDLFPVLEFDFADGTKMESLSALKRDMEKQGKGTLFFLMGHTVDREVFFDNQTLSPPAKMILIERNLIKFLRVSRENMNTLRNILAKQEGIDPVEGAGIKVEELPQDIKSLLEVKK